MSRQHLNSYINKVFLSASLATLVASCSPESFQSSVSTQSVPPPISPVQAISCTLGQNGTPQITSIYPTQGTPPNVQCMSNPGLPGSATGFEMNNLEVDQITLNANDPINGTHNAVNLYIEIATYVKPDTIVINAVSTTGTTTELIYICNFGTDTIADPTASEANSNGAGTVRPYSDTIIPFYNVPLPAGTAYITVAVDVNTPYNDGSPTYIGMWNLNEFSDSIAQIPTSGLGNSKSYNFRPQSAPLTQYNDQPLEFEPLGPGTDPNNPYYLDQGGYCLGAP
jgi:hypothetical protein